MKVYYSDHYPIPLLNKPRLLLTKYSLLRQRLLLAGMFNNGELLPALPANDQSILCVHTQDYYERACQGILSAKEMRRIGFPWSEELITRARVSVGATIAACRSAMIDGLAVNLGGGTHHAYPDHGEGYCVFNDVAIATRAMQTDQLGKRIAILDCDVHQGNGTAFIFVNDPDVFTFSIHCSKNFPYHKETSDLDIALPPNSGDREYLQALEDAIPRALDLTHPDLVIYIAGADPYVGDQIGKLAMTKAGLLARDRLVLEECKSRSIPSAVVMGGGYAKNVDDTVEIHFNTIQLCLDLQTNVRNQSR